MFCAFPARSQDSIHRAEVFSLLDALHDTLVYHHPFTQNEDGKATAHQGLMAAQTYWQEDSLSLPAGDSIILADFFPYAAEIQTAIRCGHTILDPVTPAAKDSALQERQRRIPLLETASGQYVLTDTLKQDSFMIPQGTEVVALDGHPIRDLIDKLAYFQGFNDTDYRGGQLRYAGLALSWHYLNRFGIRDEVALTVLEDGKRGTYPVSLMYKVPEKKRPKKAKPTTFKLLPLADGEAWRLNIRSFSGRYYKHHKFSKLLKEAFSTINASGKEKLVIDIRTNGGGDMKNISELLAYLMDEEFVRLNDFYSYSPDARPSNTWNAIGLFLVAGVRKKKGRFHRPSVLKPVRPKPAGKRFTGEVVVLINEMSFSASTLFGHWFKEYERGKIVGRTSGGSTTVTYGGSMHTYPIGDQFSLKLPNYRLELSRPLPGNLTPHVEVKYTQEDVFEDRDVQLGKALEMLGLPQEE